MASLVLPPQSTPSKDRVILLEPNAWKLARSVLRGERDSNVPALPDTNQDLETIRRYKNRKVWDRHYKRIQGQFEKLKWVWENDIPTKRLNGAYNKTPN